MTGLYADFAAILTSEWRSMLDRGGPTKSVLDRLVAAAEKRAAGNRGQPYTKADEAAVRAELAESAQPPAPAAAPAPRRRTRAPAGGGKAKPPAGRRTAQGGAK